MEVKSNLVGKDKISERENTEKEGSHKKNLRHIYMLKIKSREATERDKRNLETEFMSE